MTAAPELFPAGLTRSVDVGGVVAYTRVSTKAQAGPDAYGPQAQLAAVEEWAAANNRVIVEVFQDEVSGTMPFASRPGLAAALVRLAADGLDGLVVPRLDRIARQLHEQEACLAHVWRTGHRVYSVDVGEIRQDDPADPMRTALRQMMGVFAQLERGMIVARMTSGRRAKRAAGGWASGPAPYGWRLEAAGLVEVGEAQAVIATIRARAGAGETMARIAAALTAEGVAGPEGGAWSKSAVWRVLHRAESNPCSAPTRSVDV